MVSCAKHFARASRVCCVYYIFQTSNVTAQNYGRGVEIQFSVLENQLSKSCRTWPTTCRNQRVETWHPGFTTGRSGMFPWSWYIFHLQVLTMEVRAQINVRSSLITKFATMSSLYSFCCPNPRCSRGNVGFRTWSGLLSHLRLSDVCQETIAGPSPIPQCEQYASMPPSPAVAAGSATPENRITRFPPANSELTFLPNEGRLQDNGSDHGNSSNGRGQGDGIDCLGSTSPEPTTSHLPQVPVNRGVQCWVWLLLWCVLYGDQPPCHKEDLRRDEEAITVTKASSWL